MKLVGKTRKGGTAVELAADTKRVARYTFPAAARVPKLTAFLDGLGSGTGNQLVRGVIYDAAGNLVALGDEVSILDGQTGQWVDLPIPDVGGSVVSQGDYDLGILAGGNDKTVRIYGDDPGSGALTGTSPLTVSGNEINDAIRALNVVLGTSASGQMIDGRGYFRVTNMVPNGGAETDALYTKASVSATVVRSIDYARFGGASFKINVSVEGVDRYGWWHASTGTTEGGSANGILVAGGQTYTFSCYVKVPVALSGSGPAVKLRVIEWDNAGGVVRDDITPPITNLIATYGATFDWVRVSYTVTMQPTTTNVSLRVNVNNAVGDVYVDGVQFEIGAAANAYVDTNGAIASQAQGTGDSSFGIRRPATNLFRRGQCDSTTDWLTAGTGTTRAIDVGVVSPFSSQSIACTTGGTGVSDGLVPTTDVGQAAAAGVVGVGSIWFKGIAGSNYVHRLDWVNTDATTTTGTNTAFVATGAWQLLVPLSLAVAVGKTGDQLRLRVLTSVSARVETFWASHPMLEKGQSAVAPYVATSGGVTATHSRGRVQAPSSLLDGGQGFVALRVRTGLGSAVGADGGSNAYFWSWGVDTGDWLAVRHGSGVGNKLTFTSRTGGGAALTVEQVIAYAAGDSLTIIAAWDATWLYISVNGAAFTKVARSSINNPALSRATFEIGEFDGVFGNAESDVFWLAGGARVPSDADAATIHGFGDADPSFGAMPGGPTILWTANDANYIYTTSGRWNIDSYTDGASASFGSSVPLDMDMSIFATYISAWTPRQDDDDYKARLPFGEAQQALASSGETTVLHGTLGWHGTSVDRDRGAFCLAKADGPFAGLVGRKLRISNGVLSVIALCHDTEDDAIYDDLSVSRRMYAELSTLGEHPINVRVGVIEE